MKPKVIFMRPSQPSRNLAPKPTWPKRKGWSCHFDHREKSLIPSPIRRVAGKSETWGSRARNNRFSGIGFGRENSLTPPEYVYPKEAAWPHQFPSFLNDLTG